MSRQQRRAEERRQRREGRPSDAGGGAAFQRFTAAGGWEPTAPDTEALRRDAANQRLQWLVSLAGRGGVGRATLTTAAEREISRDDDRVHDEQLTARLRSLVASRFERGWQPRELVFVADRRDRRTGDLVATLARDHADLHAVDTVPPSWSGQLEQLVVRTPFELAGSATLHARLGAAGRSRGDAWADLLLLAAMVEQLPPLEPLGPPPSAWGAAGLPGAGRQTRPDAGRSGGSRSDDRDKMLDKIRALLAKAESTDFAHEAEVFTAKAQDLMSRHAIDEALLAADSGSSVDVGAARVLVDNPYAAEKAYLLNAVAGANRCRMVWFGEVSIATLVGTPVDVDQVEMLFTSLLIQATRAMAEAGSTRAGSHDRSPAYRKSFLAAYGVRIGERLAEADQAATASYGTDLVRVLDQQHEAVEHTFAELFPHTVSRSSGTRYVATGWNAGREAADRARLARGRITDG